MVSYWIFSVEWISKIMKHYNIPIFIPHLGCPYDCIYCNQKIIAAQIEIPEPHQVVNIIETYLDTIPEAATVEVAFFGGNFTAVNKQQQEDYLGVIQPYLEQGRVASIRVSTRPDYIDETELDLLAHYGVKLIELGVQSMSENVLRASGRNYGPEDVNKSCHLIKERRFDLGIQLMIGLPGDSHTQDIETTHQIISLRPQVVRIYPTLIIADTALEAMCNRGEYATLGLDEAVTTCRDMFCLFQKESIRVIRMGLYPGEELRREGVVKAGPFHSSFGELVEQNIFKRQAEAAIMLHKDKFGKHSEIELHVHFRDISKMTGRQRISLNELEQEFDLGGIRLVGKQDLDRNCIGVSAARAEQTELLLTRKQFLGVPF
jgi:histone acetyltransferase (RNA polymerase elongator complex component)